MLKSFIAFFLFLTPCYLFAQPAVNIIPAPVSLSVHEGQFFLDQNTALKFDTNNKDLFHAATFFNAYIKNISGETLPVNTSTKKSISLQIKATDKIGDEGYILKVTPESIQITANAKTGIVYGMQTLFSNIATYTHECNTENSMYGNIRLPSI